YRPEGIHRRELAGWKRQRVIMLAAIEQLVIRQPSCHWIHRFHRVVAVNPSLRSCSAQQPVAMIKIPVAEGRGDTPTIDVLTKSSGFLVHLRFASFHPLDEGNFLFLWQSL